MELPKQHIQDAVNKIAKDEGFVKYDIKWSEGADKGAGFMGILYKIKITGTKQNGDEANLNLFCKVPTDTEVMRTEFKIHDSFEREIVVYTEIFKDFESFQEEKGLRNKYIAYPKCYATSCKDYEEFLVLENLSARDFILFDRTKPLDYEHVLLVIREFGKFHSISFALKDQKPEVLKKYEGRLPELIIRDPFEGALKKMIKTFTKSAVASVQLEGIYQEKWTDFHQNFLKYMRTIYHAKDAEPYAVISHGDCWTNNILFQYENGKPKQLRFIDFQLSRYCSVAIDIAYFLFTCTSKAFRDKHYKTLLDEYYNSLSSSIRDLGSDPEKLFPRSAFDDQMKKFGVSVLGIGIVDIPMIVTNPEDAQSMEIMMDDASGMTENKSKLAVKQRLTECIIDLVDLGYL